MSRQQSLSTPYQVTADPHVVYEQFIEHITLKRDYYADMARMVFNMKYGSSEECAIQLQEMYGLIGSREDTLYMIDHIFLYYTTTMKHFINMHNVFSNKELTPPLFGHLWECCDKWIAKVTADKAQALKIICNHQSHKDLLNILYRATIRDCADQIEDFKRIAYSCDIIGRYTKDFRTPEFYKKLYIKGDLVYTTDKITMDMILDSKAKNQVIINADRSNEVIKGLIENEVAIIPVREMKIIMKFIDFKGELPPVRVDGEAQPVKRRKKKIRKSKNRPTNTTLELQTEAELLTEVDLQTETISKSADSEISAPECNSSNHERESSTQPLTDENTETKITDEIVAPIRNDVKVSTQPLVGDKLELPPKSIKCNILDYITGKAKQTFKDIISCRRSINWKSFHKLIISKKGFGGIIYKNVGGSSRLLVFQHPITEKIIKICVHKPHKPGKGSAVLYCEFMKRFKHELQKHELYDD
jgi:hypothetical protein